MNKKGFLVLMVFALLFLLVGLQPASAVPVVQNDNGVGDALIYQYYNARGELTFLRVVNTSSDYGIAVKIRFREGDDSNEVLDFFICLSENDQWSAWVAGDTDPNNPALLYWYDDDTPTYPDPNGNNDPADNFLASVALKYSDTGAAAAVSADDTKEGYAEILGVFSFAPGEAIKTPNACGEALGYWASLSQAPNETGGNAYYSGDFDPATDLTSVIAPYESLFGAAVIFDPVAFATYTAYGAYSYNAVPLWACLETIPQGLTLATEGKPRWNDCIDPADPNRDTNVEAIAAVNLALTKSELFALYDIEDDLAGASDIINIFPTRRESIELLINAGPFADAATIIGGQVCIDTDDDGDCDKDVCEDIPTTIYDDEENSPTTTGFSPGETPVPQKCQDVNYVVVGLGNSPILNTSLLSYTLESPYEIGWVRETLTSEADNMTWDPWVGAYKLGLPVLGLELGYFVDGDPGWMLPLRHTLYISGGLQ